MFQALAWDLGARDWPADVRVPPAEWMAPNHVFWCQYSVQLAAVLRDASATCPLA